MFLPQLCLLSLSLSLFREKDEDWHLDIQDDVLDELSKFGSIVHIHVDKNSQQVGSVCLHCELSKNTLFDKILFYSKFSGKCVREMRHTGCRCGCFKNYAR